MSRYCECENSEYWLTVELKTGEMEALKGNAEIMSNCDTITETEFISEVYESDSYVEDLKELISEVLGDE